MEGTEGKYRVFILGFPFPASGSMRMPTKSRGLGSDFCSTASILWLKRLVLEILFMFLVFLYFETLKYAGQELEGKRREKLRLLYHETRV